MLFDCSHRCILYCAGRNCQVLKRDLMEVEELNRRCCMNLWNMVKHGQQPHGLSPRLIIPAYRGGVHRISEQEARFAFVEALTGTSFYYSVETPTSETYCFTGANGNSRSAQTDLTLYGLVGDGLNELANVEFKCGTPVLPAIEKDIEKLIQEQKSNDIIGNCSMCSEMQTLGHSMLCSTSGSRIS